MKNNILRSGSLFLNIFFALLLFSFSSVNTADGKKWDGKAYPFQALDSSQPNSGSNPFIINTGKLEYLYKLTKTGNMVGFSRENGIKGLEDF